MAQDPQSQISCLPVPQRPANHLPRIDIQHDRQVPPLPVNLDISEIRYPLLIYPGWGQPIQAQVLVALIESLHPRHPAVQLCHTPYQRSLPHQPLNTLTAIWLDLSLPVFLASPLKHHRVDIQPSRHLLNLSSFLKAKLKGLYFKVYRIPPGLSRIVVSGHILPPLVRRRRQLKRGNRTSRLLDLLTFISRSKHHFRCIHRLQKQHHLGRRARRSNKPTKH